MMTIRLATEAEAPTCAEIWHACWPSAPWRGGYHLRDARRFVAEVGGTIVGFAESFPGRLQWLCVLPDARRSGVGSALVDAVEADLVARGNKAVAVWVFAGDDALAFYEARGFSPTGSTHKERRDGKIETLLQLSKPTAPVGGDK